MLKYNTVINNKVIVFSKWTRKNYAIFASLRKQVVIAQLTIDVCKKALLKNLGLIQFIDINQDVDKIVLDSDELTEKLNALLVLPSLKTDIYNTAKNINYSLSPYIEFSRYGLFILITIINFN